jgi:hypothetical protein
MLSRELSINHFAAASGRHETVFSLGVTSGFGARRRGSVARLIPALLAVYELRNVLGSVGRGIAAASGGGSQALDGSTRWALLLLALGSALSLREMTRGLKSHINRPAWSRALLRSWLQCSGALLAILCALGCSIAALGGHTALIQVFASMSWWAIPAGLLAGLLLAASLYGTSWVLHAVALRRRRSTPGRRRPLTLLHPLAASLPKAATPLLAGWSDRGPPPISRLQLS